MLEAGANISSGPLIHRLPRRRGLPGNSVADKYVFSETRRIVEGIEAGRGPKQGSRSFLYAVYYFEREEDVSWRVGEGLGRARSFR